MPLKIHVLFYVILLIVIFLTIQCKDNKLIVYQSRTPATGTSDRTVRKRPQYGSIIGSIEQIEKECLFFISFFKKMENH